MKIETKFNHGDTVWFIDETEVEQNCKYCEGTAKVKIKDKEFDCPGCRGSGKRDDKIISFVKGQLTIFDIKIWCTDTPIEIKYYDSIGSGVREEDCFTTKKEAEKECRRRNKC